MADEAPKKPTIQFTNHAKVSAAVIAGAVTHLLIGIAKTHGLDLSAYEPDLIVVISGLVGYLTPDA